MLTWPQWVFNTDASQTATGREESFVRHIIFEEEPLLVLKYGQLDVERCTSCLGPQRQVSPLRIQIRPKRAATLDL